MFISANGSPIDPRTYQDLFHRQIKKAGIADANYHCLRHTFATRAIENGMDILVLSKIFGHAQPSTTLNIYGHVLTEHKRESMQKISGLYGESDINQENECDVEDMDDSAVMRL